MTDCLFCKIRDGEVPANIIYEDEHLLAFEDVNPQAPVHILLIPRKHIATINEIQEADAQLVARLYMAAKKIAVDKGVAEEGYRLVMNCNEKAGQTVFHLHLHMLAGRTMTWPPG